MFEVEENNLIAMVSGRKFAMMELKSLISQILYNFYLEPVDRIDDIKLIATMILRPLKPIRMKMIRIDR